MKLSHHEQRILDEIQQRVQADDPEFFASMTGSRRRRGRSGWGAVISISGLVTFMTGAVLVQAAPGWGVLTSLVGFLAMCWGVRLLCSGARADPWHSSGSPLRQRLGRLWESMQDPPPTGMSP